MKKLRLRSLLAFLFAFAMIAAACGSDGDDAASDDGGSSDDSSSSDDSGSSGDDGGAGVEGTLRVLIHQNPPGVEFFEAFNDEFEAANPGVTIDLAIINADDISTQNQTRLTAGAIDVTTISQNGFDKGVQPFMTGADTPYWQQLIEAGLLMDLSGQPYIGNYDDAAVESVTVDGGVYGVPLGRVTYSGMFVNLDLLAEVGVDVPTTWDEYLAACDAVIAAGFKCSIAGGADGWPIFVGTYGLLGALYPDQGALVEGLWTGDVTWNDEQGLELFNRYAAYAANLDAESAGLTGDAAGPRFAAGDIAFGPMGGWMAGPIDDAASFEWSYIPFPGSDNAEDNQLLFGKNDMTLAVAADTPVADLAHAYLTAFSEQANYNDFANATGYIPTQATATLETTLGQSIAPILQAGNFRIGFEQLFVAPKGVGQWANGSLAAQWLYNGDFGDPVEAANQSQADLDSGLSG
jgi:raffinose/stachyose/melibiose transport system substrate-binding protein